MHFVDAWMELGPGDLVRLLGPLALLILSAFIPGQRIRQVTALGVTVMIPLLRELGAAPPLAAGWFLLWLLLGLWSPGDPEDTARRPLAKVGGGVETGTVGLALGLVLALLCDRGRGAPGHVAGGDAARIVRRGHAGARDPAPDAAPAHPAGDDGLRGDGLWASRCSTAPPKGAQIQAAPTSAEALLAATWLAVVLALKVTVSRERYAGTGWVSDAHDLHD